LLVDQVIDLVFGRRRRRRILLLLSHPCLLQRGHTGLLVAIISIVDVSDVFCTSVVLNLSAISCETASLLGVMQGWGNIIFFM